MKNLLSILIALSLMTSCKKEKMENNSKTITGRIVQDCGMTPLANTSMKLFVSESQSFTGSEVSIYDFTSDANGNFKFTVNLDDGKYVNEVRLGGTSITPDGPNENNMGTITL